MANGGTPPHVPTPGSRDKVAGLVRAGIGQRTICKVLDICHATLIKYYRQELDTAMAEVVAEVAESMYGAARQAHTCQPAAVSAGKFILNTVGGYSKQAEVVVTDVDSQWRELSPEGRKGMRKLLTEERAREAKAKEGSDDDSSNDGAEE